MKKEGVVITQYNHPEIYEWLSEHVLGYENNQELFVLSIDKNINAYRDVSLRRNTTEIKHPFGYVKGFFSCAYCKNLTSLVGSPKEVRGGFSCAGCSNLTSLIGSPEKVGGYFSCGICENLTSLVGSPKEVRGSFFSCVDCENLTSFKGLPKIINGIIDFGDCQFSTDPSEKQKYNLYVDMWIELLESVSENGKWEYINNYKDRVDGDDIRPIIPKEVVNKYKIDFLLKKVLL